MSNVFMVAARASGVRSKVAGLWYAAGLGRQIFILSSLTAAVIIGTAGISLSQTLPQSMSSSFSVRTLKGLVNSAGIMGMAVPIDLNEQNDAVGHVMDEGLPRAAWWPSGNETPSLFPGTTGAQSYATAINNNRQVVGDIMTDGKRRAVLWNPEDGPHDLGTLGGDEAHAADISDGGVVVGWSTNKEGTMQAFTWTASQGMQTLPGTGCLATAIGARNRVVGSCGEGDEAFASLWNEDRNLFSMGAGIATAMTTGPEWIVGSGPQLQRPRAFFPYHDIGPFMGSAWGVNLGRQVVGVFGLFDGADSHAFMFNGGYHNDLNVLNTIKETGFSFGFAADINNSGAILGYGIQAAGPPAYGTVVTGFLLQPGADGWCDYSLSVDLPQWVPNFLSPDPDGGLARFHVATSGGGGIQCAWVARESGTAFPPVSDWPWIEVDSPQSAYLPGLGNGWVDVTITPNDTGSWRVGQLEIAGQHVWVQQSAAFGNLTGTTVLEEGTSEGASSTTATVRFSLSRKVLDDVRVHYFIEPVTAQLSDGPNQGGDFVALQSASVIIPAGETEANLVFVINDDTQVEGAETFRVHVTGINGPVTWQGHVATVEIRESDQESDDKVGPTDPAWSAYAPPGTVAEISARNPRSGLGSLELTSGANASGAFIREGPAPGFGTFGQLTTLSFEWFIEAGSYGALPPGFALRVYPYGDPRSFFLNWNPCTPSCMPRPTGSWQSTELIGHLSIQRAEGPAPASLAEVPADAPIVGIHIRQGWAEGQPWAGYVDNVRIGFAGGISKLFNFEVSDGTRMRRRPEITWPTPAAIPENTPLSVTELNASTATAGRFTYSKALGTMLPADVHPISVIFTPDDPTRDQPITKTVLLTVTGTSLVTPSTNSWVAWPDGSGLGVTVTEPRSGSGSLELRADPATGPAYFLERRARPFGVYGDLQTLSFEWFIDPASATAQPPQLALRVYDYGDPRTFFLYWESCSSGCEPHPTGRWEATNLIGRLSIHGTEGHAPPASLADIPPNAPITGIHIRAHHAFGEPWRGFVDNVAIGFGNSAAITYTFDVPAWVRFSDLNAPIDTRITPVDAAGLNLAMPEGFVLTAGVQAVEISTTASVTGPLQVCFLASALSDDDFARAEVLHGIGGAWVVEPTIRDTATETICGTVSSLSPFAVGRRLDMTPPLITITRPLSSAAYLLNASPVATFDCTDPESDIASCTGDAMDTASVGSRTFTARAVNRTGLTAEKTVSYSVGYQAVGMFDQTRSHKSGSTVPVKLQLLDADGRNVSSSSVVVKAGQLVRISSEAASEVSDSGNANPDSTFRYVDQSYVYNLSTKGMSVGTYELQFTAAGDPTVHRVRFAVR